LHFASAGAHGLEHFAHLLVLAEEVVDLLDGGAGAEGDALAVAAVDDGGVAALLGGEDDGDKDKREGLWHQGLEGAGFQPSMVSHAGDPGLRPRL
jgi:hypothetical protein